MAGERNLLFIFTDQQRADTLACYGNQRLRAPHLNALAEHSFVFESAYCTQPVCTPSRSSIMTGLYPHTTGCLTNNLPLSADAPTIAELAGDGFERGYFGKWHLGDEISPQRGFSHWVSIEENYRAYYRDPADLNSFSDFHHFLVEHGFEPDLKSEGARVFARQTAADVPEGFTKAAFLGARAAEFVHSQADRPWMLYVNFLEPHPPYSGPLNDLYADDVIATAPTFCRAPPADAPAAVHRKAAQYDVADWRGFNLATEAGWRRLRRNYAGLVTQVDRAVGQILEALDASGQADRTIVVFTSDHGDMLGEHGIQGKGVQYESAARIPLLLRVPWLAERARTIPGRISQIDLVPTLLELLDRPLPSHLHGRSQVPVLTGDRDLASNDMFVEWNVPDSEGRSALKASEINPRRTVIGHEGWKLTLNRNEHDELYDLTADPYEQHNRVDDPDQRPRIEDLTARLQTWQRQVGDPLPLA